MRPGRNCELSELLIPLGEGHKGGGDDSLQHLGSNSFSAKTYWVDCDGISLLFVPKFLKFCLCIYGACVSVLRFGCLWLRDSVESDQCLFVL